MFGDLLKRLLEPAPHPDALTDSDARLALCALLVRVARSDGDYAAAEITRITRIIAARYALTTLEAEALRQEAEEVEAAAPDTVRFTRAIKAAVPYEERLAVIEALWEVALADGLRDAGEDRLLRMVSGLLGVSDPDSARARQRVTRAP
jgi:uncharacterized tellurite resistance protein B-like protein